MKNDNQPLVKQPARLTNFRLRISLVDKLKRAARKESRTQVAVVSMALEAWFKALGYDIRKEKLIDGRLSQERTKRKNTNKRTGIK